MTFDKNTMVDQPLLIKVEEGTDSKRLKLVESRLNNLIVDSVSDNQSWIEIFVSQDQIFLGSSLLDERARIGISFHDGASNHRRLYGGGKSQHLAKAVGVDKKKGLSVIDATAGLGGDSFVLACLGARVQMLERNPVLALMIEDALRVAKVVNMSADLEICEIIDRMSITQTDSAQWLKQQPAGLCDVIFLDPMFPERKKKAAVKKEMQILQYLLSEAEKSESARLEEEVELLKVALLKADKRVVVKRPRHAPPLAGEAPGYSVEGKSTRFDIYSLKKIS